MYSDAGADSARSTLAYFEQLRAFFLSQASLKADNRPPVRIIAFRSVEEYNSYRIRSTAAAYYIGTESRDYIVMPALTGEHFNVAGHEYAHFLIHATGLGLPAWLNEGLSDVFSTVRIGEHNSSIGADLPARSRLLRSRAWMPLQDLLAVQADSPLRNDRNREALFYSQCWALAHMLMLSPDYSPHFPAFVSALSTGLSSSKALTTVYGKSTDAVDRDLRVYAANHSFRPVPLPGVAVPPMAAQTYDLPAIASRSMLADLVGASGDLVRSESLYRELARESPASAEFPAALGSIALRMGDRERARREWERSIELGIADPALCYQYAVLAQDAGLADTQIRAALERAVLLKPDFDDAHYLLALTEKRSGDYEAALAHFQAMRDISPKRAYAYWSALSDALLETGRREKARAAALLAGEHAATPRERALAAQLAHMAETDLAVQFTRDANGRPKLATARAPHNAPDWNPFIEPGDRIQRSEAVLQAVECSGDGIRVILNSENGPLALSMPDPSHVQLRNIPAGSFEFTCGPQAVQRVTVEYNQAGLLRGLEFPAHP